MQGIPRLSELVDLRFDHNIIQRAQRDALRPPAAQLVQQFDRLRRDVAFADAHTDLRITVLQVAACGLDPADDLLAERARPVGQHRAQLDPRQLTLFCYRLAVCFPRGKVAGLPDRIQHALAHIRAHIGAVVQHAVHRPARHPRAVGHGLNGWSFVHMDTPSALYCLYYNTLLCFTPLHSCCFRISVHLHILCSVLSYKTTIAPLSPAPNPGISLSFVHMEPILSATGYVKYIQV